MTNVGKLYEEIVKYLREYESAMEDKRIARAETIPERLRLYIAKTGITKDKLAEELGVSRMQLFRWIKGGIAPGREALKKMEEMNIIDRIED